MIEFGSTFARTTSGTLTFTFCPTKGLVFFCKKQLSFCLLAFELLQRLSFKSASLYRSRLLQWLHQRVQRLPQPAVNLEIYHELLVKVQNAKMLKGSSDIYIINGKSLDIPVNLKIYLTLHFYNNLYTVRIAISATKPWIKIKREVSVSHL